MTTLAEVAAYLYNQSTCWLPDHPRAVECRHRAKLVRAAQDLREQAKLVTQHELNDMRTVTAILNLNLKLVALDELEQDEAIVEGERA